MNRRTLGFVFLFAIPPAIGTALATLRVTGGASLELAVLFGALVGIGVGGFLLLLTMSGHTEEPTFQTD